MGRGQSKRSEGAYDRGGGIWSCSTGGNDSIPKHAANGHQQSIEQYTAAQTRVPLTGLCQSVNTALANYNLTACNLRLSKLHRRSITLPPLSRSTPRALGSKSVWRSPVSQWISSLSWFLGSRHFSLIQGMLFSSPSLSSRRSVGKGGGPLSSVSDSSTSTTKCRGRHIGHS